MQLIKNLLRDTYYNLRRNYAVNGFNRYRRKYNSYSFTSKKKMASVWLRQYPEQSHFDFVPVKYWFENIVSKPASVIEIGGWRGDLALKSLNDFNFIEAWHNYDLIEDNGMQKCVDTRYRLITLNDYIWNLSPAFGYNSLIATHMIEHINWKEFSELVKWIPPGIESVLFEAPLPSSEENFNWKGDYSSHVFEKGWAQVNAEMKKQGFNEAYTAGSTVIYKRGIVI